MRPVQDGCSESTIHRELKIDGARGLSKWVCQPALLWRQFQKQMLVAGWMLTELFHFREKIGNITGEHQRRTLCIPKWPGWVLTHFKTTTLNKQTNKQGCFYFHICVWQALMCEHTHTHVQHACERLSLL